MEYPEPLERLIGHLKRFPSIGPKSAQRLAFYILSCSNDQVNGLAQALVDVKSKIGVCKLCGNISEDAECLICQDRQRQSGVLCVVATARDLLAVERTRAFRGRYHVLGGLVSPLDGVGPEDLSFGELVRRIDSEQITEVIVATNPTVPGEATALLLQRILGDRPVKLSRLALGLPMGSDLLYADEATLGQALSARRQM